MILRLLGIAALASVRFADAQSPKHVYGISDWAALPYVSARAVSPDGSWILYSVYRGAESGPGITQWRLIHPDGEGMRALELPRNFNAIGFTIMGRLYGTLLENGVPEIVTFSMDGLTPNARPLSEIIIPGDIRSISLSPDGKRFAVIADPRPKDPLRSAHTVVQPSESSLFVVGEDGTGGKWWCPELRHIADTAWSPDSSRIAVKSAAPKIGYHYAKSWIDVASEEGVKNVAVVDNVVGGIAWINGAREIAFTSTTTSVLTSDSLFTIPSTGGSPVNRTANLAGSVLGIKADLHGTLWVNVDRGVQNEIDKFVNGKLELAYRWPSGYVAGTPTLSNLDSANGQLVFAVGDPEHCQNIAITNSDSSLKRITQEGDAQLADIALGEVKVVHWTSKEGIHLEGIVTFPPGFVKGRRYPFVVLPHGGPESNDVLSLFGDTRYLAGLGYVVLQPEYRGSTGYGSTFLNAVYQH